MRIHVLIAVAGFLIAGSGALAQTPELLSTTSDAKLVSTRMAEAGAHHQWVERVYSETNEKGDSRLVTNTQAYCVLATGLNRVDPITKQWVPARAEFETTDSGHIISRQTAYQLILPPRLEESESGVVDLLGADGHRFRASTLGIALVEMGSGKSMLLAQVKPCRVEQISETEALAEDAFEGIKADIRFRIMLPGIEADVILREKPVLPSGWDASRCQLEVLTELFPEKPDVQEGGGEAAKAGDGEPGLRFGEMRLGRGKAFGVENEEKSVPVWASRETLDKREFIIEMSRWNDLEPFMEVLPEAEESDGEVRSGALRQVPERLRTVRRAGGPRFEEGRMVGAEKAMAWADAGNGRRRGLAAAGRVGVVMDYQLLGSGGQLTLRSATTYLVAARVDVSSSLTIEGGAVVKFTNTSAALINVDGSVICKTGPYKPCTFTDMYDSTIGDIISTNQPTNLFYGGAIEIHGTGVVLEHLRIRHAGIAVTLGRETTLRHVQMVDCTTGVGCRGSAIHTNSFYAGNLLMTNVTMGFVGSTFDGTVEYLTADQLRMLASAWGPASLNVVNGIVANVPILVPTNMYGNFPTLSGTNNGFYASPTFGSQVITTTNNPFLSVGAGGYYLATNSPFRNVGTSPIDPALASALRKKTTYAPIVLTGYRTNDLVLSPQVQRDSDGTYDLGWHSDPLDYCVSELILLTRTLVLTNGVAVGAFGPYGARVGTGSLVSEGTPMNPNWVVPYHAVQEQPMTWGTASSTRSLFRVDALVNPARVVRLRFTRVSSPADPSLKRMLFSNNGGTATTFELRDCQLRGLYWDFFCYYNQATTASLVNNIFEGGTIAITQDYNTWGQPFAAVNLYNNLFWRSTLVYYYDNPATVWTVKDNVFDNAQQYMRNSGVVFANNGYINSTPMGGGSGDVVLTNFTYATGPLGDYYQASTNFVDAGSRTASQVGLYHYTTQTTQAKEMCSVVNLGAHYVATVNGMPSDDDGDGVPDYAEDLNGNGAVDAGETHWQNYVPENDLTGNPGLEVFTPLR